MKQIFLKKSKVDHLNTSPTILVIGQNQVYKSKLLNQLLSDDQFYSQKYGRIIYVGQRKYKSQKIQLDELNWLQNASHEALLQKISEAKRQGIINLLIVINTRFVNQYRQIIAFILTIRNEQLKGIISILVNLNSVQQIQKQSLRQFNTIFFFQQQEKLNKFINNDNYQQKRKKDVYIWSKNMISIFRQIKD